MLVLSLILILLSFLQAVFLPWQIVLLVLINRSLIKEDTANLYLAFGLGLLASFLDRFPLGLLSILYLSMVLAIYLLKKTNISNQIYIIFPVAFVALILDQLARTLQSGAKLSLDINSILFQLVLVLPIYILVRFWEERFTPKKDVKLKIR